MQCTLDKWIPNAARIMHLDMRFENSLRTVTLMSEDQCRMLTQLGLDPPDMRGQDEEKVRKLIVGRAAWIVVNRALFSWSGFLTEAEDETK